MVFRSSRYHYNWNHSESNSFTEKYTIKFNLWTNQDNVCSLTSVHHAGASRGLFSCLSFSFLLPNFLLYSRSIMIYSLSPLTAAVCHCQVQYGASTQYSLHVGTHALHTRFPVKSCNVCRQRWPIRN